MQVKLNARRLASPVLALILALISGLALGLPAQALNPPGKPTLYGDAGADALPLQFTPVAGATAYRIQASTSSSFSSPISSIVDSSGASPQLGAVTGLTVSKTYYVRVQTWDKATNAATSGWSSTNTAVTKNTAGVTSAIAVDNVGGTAVELEWVNVAGAPGWIVRAKATGKPTLYKSSGTNGVIFSGLTKGTSYTFSIAVEQPANDGLPGIRLGAYSAGKTVTTSNYPVAAPADLAVLNQQPYQFDLSWTAAVGAVATDQYKVEYALDAAMTDRYKSVIVAGTSTTVKGLSSNTQYYVRVRTVTAAGAARSDRSDYILARTRIPWGYIAGTVNCGNFCAHVVAGAYKGNEMVTQVSVASDGKYELQVRPGAYRVLLTYLDSDNENTLWVGTAAGGVALRTAAATLTAPLNGTVTAPEVTLGPGGIATGVIRDENGELVRSHVDVSAIDASGRVVQTHQNDENGRYTLKGLPPGTYTLHVNYSGIGYKIERRSITVAAGATVSTNVQLDLVTSWYRPYGAYIKGTKAVGKFLVAQATYWRPTSEQPYARANAMYVRWKRNGVAITNWCLKTTVNSCGYRPGSGDRGKRLSIQAKAVHVGYLTGYATSKVYTIR